MKKIYRFENSDGFGIDLVNSPVTFTDKSKKYLINQIEFSTSVKINSVGNYQQDGEDYLSNNLEIASIDLTVIVMGDDVEDFKKLKKDLEKAFNPKLNEGILIDVINKRYIKCICEKINSPQYDNECNATFSIPLKVCYPYWQDYNVAKQEIALWRGAFHFPLRCTTEKKAIMGYREPSLIVNVVNNGDIETGFKIVFKAVGTVKNPSIFNINTREMLKIDITMKAGQIITINTGDDPEAIMEDGDIKTDIINLIDLDSDFIKLKIGNNLFRYDAEENLNALNLDVYYNQKYICEV